MSFRISNINSTLTLERSLYNVSNNLINTKVLTEQDGENYNVSNNTFYTSNFAPNFDWSALGSGLSGGVTTCNAIAIDSKGNVYIGGNFTTAGGVTVSNIVRWDGYNWYPLGSGLDNICFSLAIDSNDNVYAGGAFTTVGSVTVNKIAKWSPSTGVWSALGTSPNIGLNNPCFSLAIDSNDNVYAGGNFTAIFGTGGLLVNNIAKWSPSTSTWAALGTSPNIGLNEECYVIAIDSNDNVYAGGYFTTAGGVTVNRIAKWDGSNWSALGSGLGLPNDECNAIAIDSNDNVYAGGAFTTAGSVTVNKIAKWSPSTGVWSALGSGLNGICRSLTIDSNDNVYAGGTFTATQGGTPGTLNKIAKWDGSNWSALGSGLDNTCSSLVIDSNDNVYTGGSFTTTQGGTLGTLNRIAYYSNQTYINLVYNSRKLKTIRGPADSTLVFVNSDTNKASIININNLV
jgi:hypothetical protein